MYIEMFLASLLNNIGFGKVYQLLKLYLPWVLFWRARRNLHFMSMDRVLPFLASNSCVLKVFMVFARLFSGEKERIMRLWKSLSILLGY
jgi:hypothetical protein